MVFSGSVLDTNHSSDTDQDGQCRHYFSAQVCSLTVQMRTINDSATLSLDCIHDYRGDQCPETESITVPAKCPRILYQIENLLTSVPQERGPKIDVTGLNKSQELGIDLIRNDRFRRVLLDLECAGCFPRHYLGTGLMPTVMRKKSSFGRSRRVSKVL